MRFKIICELVEGNSFPIDYHSKITMLLKSGLREYQDIFEDFFGTDIDKIQEDIEKNKKIKNKNKNKKYCWSVYFSKVKFTKEEIIFKEDEKKFIVNFSVLENSDSINIYNAFINIKFKEMKIVDGVKVKVTNVVVVPTDKIEGNKLIAKTMSPIICRDHNLETKKDTYYTGSDEKFVEIMKRNLYLQMKNEYGECVKKDIEDLVIGSKGLRKIVVKFYKKSIDASIGVVLFEGKNYLLDYIYNSGFGSITGSGFGLLEKIKKYDKMKII